jgi:hypothetical protein
MSDRELRVGSMLLAGCVILYVLARRVEAQHPAPAVRPCRVVSLGEWRPTPGATYRSPTGETMTMLGGPR